MKICLLAIAIAILSLIIWSLMTMSSKASREEERQEPVLEDWGTAPGPEEEK